MSGTAGDPRSDLQQLNSTSVGPISNIDELLTGDPVADSPEGKRLSQLATTEEWNRRAPAPPDAVREPSEAAVEAAAMVLCEAEYNPPPNPGSIWKHTSANERKAWQDDARRALAAAYAVDFPWRDTSALTAASGEVESLERLLRRAADQGLLTAMSAVRYQQLAEWLVKQNVTPAREAAAREFVHKVVLCALDGNDADGGDIQDWAVMAGILAPHEVSEPCGEACNCADYDSIPGTCYRFTPAYAPVERGDPKELAAEMRRAKGAVAEGTQAGRSTGEVRSDSPSGVGDKAPRTGLAISGQGLATPASPAPRFVTNGEVT